MHELREQCRKLNIPGIRAAEVRGFFDNLDGGRLRECIQQRVNEGRILRLIGKGLPAGVLAAGELTHPDKGVPPGGSCSPRIANLCVHQVLDDWVVKDGQPRMQGRCLLTRVADDFLMGCEWEADARRGMEVLPKRCHCFSLTMHPAKTARMAFPRPRRQEHSTQGQGPFALRGFTPYWAQTRRGYWVITRKTGRKRLRRFMKALWTGCRENRHEPVPEHYRTLCAQRRGSYPYDGIRGNVKMLAGVFAHPERAWRSWLSRRSHKGPIHGQKFEGSLRDKLPLPRPRIMHNL